MIQTVGKAYEYKGGVVIQTTRPPDGHVSDDVIVLWRDSRTISPEQQRKAWVLIGEIAQAYGYLSAADREQLNSDMKRMFLLTYMDKLSAEAIGRFSLGNVDQTTARMYITFLIDFVIEHDIPTKELTAEMCEDIEVYVYQCMMHRRCAVCRKPADLHHIDRVGMGRNRDEICHVGMEAITLCRDHHMEAHQHGDKALLDKYHLTPIIITAEIAKKLKLGGKTK